MRARVAGEVIAENEHLLTKVSREEQVRDIVPSAALVILTSDIAAANVVDYCDCVRERHFLCSWQWNMLLEVCRLCMQGK